MDQNLMMSSDLLPDFKHKELEDKCEKHHVHLVEFANRVLCPKCAEELTEKSEQELAESLTNAHFGKLKEVNDRKKTENYIKKSLISDKKILNASFSNYKIEDEETKNNKQRARMVAKRYLDGEIFNTVLSGKVGTGKSHLAMSILKAVNEHSDPKRKCLYVSTYKLLNTLRASYSSEEKTEDVKTKLVNFCSDAYLLVLDDLGAEVGSKNNQKTAASDNFDLLNSILEKRMDLPTIFTTNLKSAQIEAVYDDRIQSRLLSGADLNSVIKFEKTNDKRNRIEF